MTQDQTLDVLKTGANVFLTGEPGSGKTHTVNRYVSWLRSHGIPVAITASTGIAATHIGGRTVHAFAGIGVKQQLTKQDIVHIVKNDRAAKRIRSARVLVIDEISMLSAGTLGMVEHVCRAVRDSDLPFGGLQVVLVGDFFQLPPVVRQDNRARQQSMLLHNGEEDIFCFSSSAWERLAVAVCYLSEQHRQEDAAFLAFLSALRRGEVSHEHRALLASRYARAAKQGMTYLFSHNAQVDQINDTELSRLPGECRVFEMTSSGQRDVVHQLKRGCLSPESLALKVGARVMFTKNDIANRFVNGTLGVVKEFSDDESAAPIVRCENGKTVRAEPLEWSVEEGWSVVARISQVPLRLAWAITVHKSQGMSLDAAHMDLSRVFEYGQGYVALSRVRALSGLSLSGINERALCVHPRMREKDAEFRAQSDAEHTVRQKISAETLTQAQEEFIQRCGGQRREPARESCPTSGAYSVNALREQHENAYRPWSTEEERQLLELFESGIKIKDIAKKLGRQRGGIVSRLKKLHEKQDDLDYDTGRCMYH